MGWYGRDNITKYYSIGFSEEELQEIDAAWEKQKDDNAENSFFKSRSRFIRHLALSCIDLEKENQRLKNILRETRVQSAAIGQSGASEENAWTGYFRDVKRNGNILYPVWG
jgi:hypothetical protein